MAVQQDDHEIFRYLRVGSGVRKSLLDRGAFAPCSKVHQPEYRPPHSLRGQSRSYAVVLYTLSALIRLRRRSAATQRSALGST